MKPDHEELARKIESEQPSRELDCAVAVQALGWLTRPNKGWPEETDYGYRKEDGGEVWPGHGGDQMVPRFTTSVDAALSLLAESVEHWGRPFNLCMTTAYGSAYVVPNDGESYGISDPLKAEGRAVDGEFRSRLARAITAAAIRALKEAK